MPEGPFGNILKNSSLDTILTIVFLLLVILFMVYSAIVAYHWTTYGQNRTQAFAAVLAYIAVGGVILLAMGAIILF